MIVLWFLLGCFWALVRPFIAALVCVLVYAAYSETRAAILRRRKRIERERATWRESVTKQTKPPPIVEANLEKLREVVGGNRSPDKISVLGDAFHDQSPRMRQLKAQELVETARAQAAEVVRQKLKSKRKKSK